MDKSRYIPDSTLIVNDDGSIYHLKLRPDQLADTVITVGDPDRVLAVSKHLDRIEHKVASREFVTHTGYKDSKRLSIISTGIGTDNIDIVLNELDALVNIDFDSRKEKEKHTQLTLVRIGTSGTVQSDIPLDSTIVTRAAVGYDGLAWWYGSQFKGMTGANMIAADTEELPHMSGTARPYLTMAPTNLLRHFCTDDIISGTTATLPGFYAAQGRHLRAQPAHHNWVQALAQARVGRHAITNFEMETAGLYAMSAILGHRCVSISAILANRATGKFSTKPAETVENLIIHGLERVLALD